MAEKTNKMDIDEEIKEETKAEAETEKEITEENSSEVKAEAAKEPQDKEADAGSEYKKEEADASETAAKQDKKDQKIAELNDKYVRLFAEFDNFRKRTDSEKAGMFTEGERTVLLKVLPLIDNFERALATIPEDEKGTPMADGLEKIYRAFTDQLKELGVVPIEAVGQEFDANLHNAVMHIDDEEQPENVIVEEFQKGYMFGDKVLRYSMVKVAN